MWASCCRYLIVFLLSLWSSQQVVSSLQHRELSMLNELASLCSNVSCNAGRECRVLSSGEPQCICKTHCSRRRHPICGSDGLVYENRCSLHRQACLKGTTIRPMFHDKSCLEDPLAILKREIDQAMEEIKFKERLTIKVPRACHQNDRDRMREMLYTWMIYKSSKYSWFKPNLKSKEVLDHFFGEMERDGNGFVDSSEWLHFLQATEAHSNIDKASKKLRKLCIEALVEEGDHDQDWRLSLTEFQSLMSPDYQPSNKYCVRDKKHYEDGTRTKVDCNGCTCACGKWVCTSRPCGTTTPSPHLSVTEEYEDMDNLPDK